MILFSIIWFRNKMRVSSELTVIISLIPRWCLQMSNFVWPAVQNPDTFQFILLNIWHICKLKNKLKQLFDYQNSYYNSIIVAALMTIIQCMKTSIQIKGNVKKYLWFKKCVYCWLFPKIRKMYVSTLMHTFMIIQSYF